MDLHKAFMSLIVDRTIVTKSWKFPKFSMFAYPINCHDLFIRFLSLSTVRSFAMFCDEYCAK